MLQLQCSHAVSLLITSPCTSPYGWVRVVHASVLPPVVSSILIALVRRCALTRVPRVHRMSRTVIAHPASHSARVHCQPVRALLG